MPEEFTALSFDPSLRASVAARIDLSDIRIDLAPLRQVDTSWRLPTGVSDRASVVVPIAPSDTSVDDLTVFEDPHRVGQPLVVAKYSLRVDAVRLRRSVDSWDLTLVLDRLQPAPGAEFVPSTDVVKLRYTVPTIGLRELEFSETTRTPGDITVSYQSSDPLELDRVFQAMTSTGWEANVAVLRTIRYAAPVSVTGETGSLFDVLKANKALIWQTGAFTADLMHPSPRGPLQPLPSFGIETAAIRSIAASPIDVFLERSNQDIFAAGRRFDPGRRTGSRRFPLPDEPIDLEPIREEPPELSSPPVLTGYQERTATFENVIDPMPFVFPPETHPGLFVGIAAGGYPPPRFIAREVEGHTYFQESEGSATFYYLPDDFRFRREDAAPHRPVMRLAFRDAVSHDDASAVLATFEFAVAPSVSLRRLEKAKAALLPFSPGPYPTGVSGPTLRSINLGTRTFSIDLGPGVPATALNISAIDLVHGFRCTIDLTVAQFQPLFEKLFARSVAIFTGGVNVALADGVDYSVEFVGQLSEAYCNTSVLEVRSLNAQPDGNVDFAIVNTLESPILLSELRIVGANQTGLVPTTIIEPQPGASGLSIPPGGTVQARIKVDAGSSVEQLVFGLGGVTVELDPEAIYEVIVDRSTPAEYAPHMKVLVSRGVFTRDPTIEALQVDIEGAEGIVISAPADGLTTSPLLIGTYPVLTPLKAALVGTAIRSQIKFQLRALRTDGSKDAWSTYEDPAKDVLIIANYTPTGAR